MTKSKVLITQLIVLLCLTQAVLNQPLSAFASNLCQGSGQQSLLQSGTNILTNTRSSNNRTHFFQIQVLYTVPSSGFKTAISTGRITGFNQAPGLDYSIRGGQVGSTSVAQFVLIINQDLSWASITAVYLISSRPDFWLGAFLPDTFSLMQSSSVLNVQYQIPSFTPSGGNYRFIILISGLKTNDNNFNVDLVTAGFNSNSGFISVQVSSTASPALELIYLSYVIFENATPYTFSTYNPLVAGNRPTYIFEGIDSMNGNTIGFQGYGLEPQNQNSALICVGQRCQGQCISSADCTRNNGVIFQIGCFLCGSNQFYDNGQCVPRCTTNQTLSNGQCVCLSGYTRINGVCQRSTINCPTNQRYNGSTCVCVDGYFRGNNGVCIAQCPQFAFYDGSSCVCNSGYVKVNNLCFFQCRQNGYRDNSGACICLPGYNTDNLNRCVLASNCGVNQFFNSATGRCQCISGYLFAQNQCQQMCSSSIPNAVLVNGVCVCIDNYTVVNGNCVPSITCNGQNQQPVNGQCVCRSGYTRNAFGNCVLASCGQNQARNSAGQCVCINGYSRNSAGVCVQNSCGQNEVRDNFGQCVCITGYARNGFGICVQTGCGTNQIRNNSGICVCIANYFRNSAGLCVSNVPCPSNQARNSLGQCVCITGYSRNVFGNCTQNGCGANEFRNNLNQCVCISGYTRNGFGVCVLASCGTNQFRSENGQCICLSGYSRNSAGICVLTGCRLNEVLSNGVCVCSPGYRRVNGDCVSSCRRNQIFDASINSCICIQGYGISSRTGFCEVCPANSYSSGLLSGCFCNQGYTYNSTSQTCERKQCGTNQVLTIDGRCICKQGYYLQNGVCKQSPTCPARSVYNTTSLKCVCTTALEYLINGTCQNCQSNSAWNGSECVCRSSYFLIGGACVQCSTNSRYTGSRCVCNFGFFGTGLTCTACASTCGTCTSTSASSCLSCVNASYSLQNGICSLSQCDPGYFYNTTSSSCVLCIEYCASCNTVLQCSQCIKGFQVLSVTGPFGVFHSCIETCGDGVKTIQECDDNNTVSGDGCSATCEIQQGWTCVGGSTTSQSQCFNVRPSGTTILKGGHVVLQGEVLQGLSMTSLPFNLTSNGCPNCDNILSVNILSSPIIPNITVDYILTTQYKFIARFDFRGLLGSFVFNFTVRINPAYSSYFTAADMQQVLVVQIDMALLAKFDPVQTLNFSNSQSGLRVEDNTSNTGEPSNAEIQQSSGIPVQALDILFPK